MGKFEFRKALKTHQTCSPEDIFKWLVQVYKMANTISRVKGNDCRVWRLKPFRVEVLYHMLTK